MTSVISEPISVTRSEHAGALEPDALVTVAEGFARTAHAWAGLLTEQERSWQLIAATDRFEAWVIAWPSGGSISYHDHGDARGAVVVAQGQLVESSLRLRDEGPVDVKLTSLETGSRLLFGPGHIHDIVNHSSASALSVHVYSPALASMTYYDLSDTGELTALYSEAYQGGVLVG